MDEESKRTERAQARIPMPPSAAKASPSLRLAKSENRKKPTASPAKANADQGNNGKSHGCGSLKMWTPLMYDSMGHGRNFGRCVVQSGGGAIATITAAKNPPTKVRILAAATDPSPVAPHSAPMSIMESPRMFSTSTRSKSVHGHHR